MTERLIESLVLVAEIAALFFAVTVAVQLFQARFGAERLRRWMGGRPLTAAFKGIALGFVTPFCTFTAVPMLVGLRQAKVPPAGYVAFIVAAPVLDPVLFGALVIIAGLETALLCPGIAFVAAVTLALVAERVGVERYMAPAESMLGSAAETDGEDNGCAASDHDWGGIGREAPSAARRAKSLLVGMAPILFVGVGLSILIETVVPPDLTERFTASNPTLAVPIAAALGTPLYVSTTVFVPIADALKGAGVGIGAIVALTIAGAGANLPEFVILAKLASPRLVATLFAYVFGVAVIGGFLTQAIVG